MGSEYKRRHCKSADRSRRHRYEEEAGDTTDDSAMPYDVFIKYMQQVSFYMLFWMCFSESCLNQTSLGPTFLFGIDRCSVYAG
jgi:hypothetical protein